MNILFLTVSRINDLSERGIYNDLMRKFRDEGHNVYVVSPSERRFKQETGLRDSHGIKLLKVKTLNIQKTNVIEKGIGTILLQYQFLLAISKYLSKVKFDLIIYSTPPITFTKVIKKIKEKYNAKTYLLLKDIFPQNAVDLGMIKKNSLLHTYFKKKEHSTYKISDFIGCMSEANLNYILKHNPFISKKKIEVNPNSIELCNNELSDKEIEVIRNKYNLPIDKTVFVYGGNLGKPQGLDFLLKVLESNLDNTSLHFLIVGNGTEYSKINKWFDNNNPSNATLLTRLPKHEYDNLVQACDVGLIFLDNRFTIPNYPSRLLSYLEYKMPVLCATDSITDIGSIAEKNGYGLWALSGDLDTLNQKISSLTANKPLIKMMGERGYNFLIENYTVSNSYTIIMNHFKSI